MQPFDFGRSQLKEIVNVAEDSTWWPYLVLIGENCGVSALVRGVHASGVDD